MIFSVKQARAYAGYTQVEMAKMLNISRDTYRKYELKPETIPIEKAKKIADITKIPLNAIFFNDKLYEM